MTLQTVLLLPPSARGTLTLAASSPSRPSRPRRPRRRRMRRRRSRQRQSPGLSARWALSPTTASAPSPSRRPGSLRRSPASTSPASRADSQASTANCADRLARMARATRRRRRQRLCRCWLRGRHGRQPSRSHQLQPRDGLGLRLRVSPRRRSSSAKLLRRARRMPTCSAQSALEKYRRACCNGRAPMASGGTSGTWTPLWPQLLVTTLMCFHGCGTTAARATKRT
mmetsp:Transcript_44061/g.101857  ORF Transcript_44061/g.101857 Transcript_44061/m.101857 type:complete len:226 (+) Transcript_44061:934-1611(+)